MTRTERTAGLVPLTVNASNVTLRQLECFVAVVEHGGFGSAAQALHLTQSAVSQAVRGLEQVLDGPLLVRGKNGVTPTNTGERVLMHARRALEAVRALTAAAIEDHEAHVGRLRLGSIRSIAAGVVRPALGAFRARYPRADVTLWEGTDREVHEWVAEGAVDIAFVGPVLDVPDDVDIVPLFDDPWYAVVPSDHPLARHGAVSLSALARYPYVLSDSGCEPAIRAMFESVDASPDVRHRAIGADTLMRMVAAGEGWTLMPGLALAGPQPESAIVLRLAPPLARGVAAVVTQSSSDSPATKLFMSMVQQQLAARAG